MKHTEREDDAFSKYLKNMKEIAEADLTDDETSDRPKWRENRFAIKRTWEEEVDAVRGVEDARPAGFLKMYGSYNKLSDKGKKEMREQILMGISKKKIRVASTVQLYTSALKKMMGIAQAVEIQEGRGDKLPDGRLQFWQLFNYKTEYHYRIWEK